MRIEEEYIKSGYFWLPEQFENKIPGVLTIKDGGEIELEIVGHFNDEIDALTSDNNLSRIIGHIEKDGLVTLDNCFYTTKNISFGGISKSKICANRVLSGAAYAKDEEVTFQTLSFSFDCMDEWVGISGINVENDLGNKTAKISYCPPEKITHKLDNGMNLEICFRYTLPGFPNLTEARITQKAYFRLKSDNLLPLSDFTNVAYKLTNLMCFAVDATVTIKNLFATSTEIQKDITERKSIPIPIQIYYQSIPYSENAPKKSSHHMLFTFGTIKPNAQSIFNSWLNAYESLSPALSLYFSTKTGAQKYIDGKFLALAQGLETYHRRTSDEKAMEQEKFENLISSIVEKCPDEHKNWLQGRLMYGNEINLGKRIKRIIEPFKDHLGNSTERCKLLRKIVDTRNYLTHYNESLKASSADGESLWVLCQKMEVIFQLHFLKVIGFTDDEINNVVENCQSIKNKLVET